MAEPALEPLRAEPGRAAILTDVDGTLAPIAARPEQASVPEPARAVLRELAGRFALVGCVSGRRAAEARRLVGVEELLYVGNHGLERLEPGMDEPAFDPELRGREELAAELVGTLDRGRLDAVGIRIEDKGPIQALHWRGAGSLAAAELEAREAAALAQARRLHPHWGRKVLELRPLAEVDKGTVIERVLGEHELRAALYAGDDSTDLDAFDGLRRLADAGTIERAVCVGVASDEGPAAIAERADVVAAGTDGFVELLMELA
ncbi:MAG: trehalose-phosphatase [Solirubrobacterales bacterium]